MVMAAVLDMGGSQEQRLFEPAGNSLLPHKMIREPPLNLPGASY
jgi:hypothetical protein